MQANELFTQPNTILLDGGMGTMLQAAGLKLGARPEELNITDPQLIESIHSRYAAAGSRIINANTFGASAHKLAGSEYTLEEIIAAGISNCKRACAPYGALAALDVGPLGELLEPNGTLAFEDAVAEYGRIVRAGVAAGADLVFFETFTDLYELKAALLAAKENCDLPILASMSFEAGGRTFTGCTVESFAVTARGLGANAVGINCSLGPKEIFPMAKRLAEALPGDFPVFVKPNAGLPRADGSGYDITPQLFAMEMKPYRDLKLFAAGGCCGTTPDFIKLLNGVFADCKPGRPAHAMPSVLCSPMDFVTVDGITVVGERINPTGKKRFQQALREGDMNYILEQAVSQSEAGAQVLDVNVGAPGVDEPAVMEQVVKALQSVVSLPLQLDSSHADALERGLRVYNGKPIVNSVNGETEVLERVLPLCKKYGAAVVGLAIDERGIQPSADARFEIAKRVVDAALAHGIPREDIYIDCLTLTASAQQQDVLATVEALARWWHPDLGRLGPDRFIGLAEETGLIVPLGRWVLRQACRQAKQWHEEFGDLAPFVSVNLAVRQSRDPNLVSDVESILRETGLEPSRLQLELTESAVMGTADEPIEALWALTKMGVRIAIDDFGTGYSNLAYLRHLPVHELKIAGSFMSGLRDPEKADPVDARIVGTLVDLAHTLGLTVTAEGVETHAQARRMGDIGCETGQGYFFARPCSAERIRAFIADHVS